MDEVEINIAEVLITKWQFMELLLHAMFRDIGDDEKLTVQEFSDRLIAEMFKDSEKRKRRRKEIRNEPSTDRYRDYANVDASGDSKS